MEIKEQVSRTPIETHKYRDKRYLTLDGADQIIPIVRADCQREIAKVLDELCVNYTTGEVLATQLAILVSLLESGTFKEGE